MNETGTAARAWMNPTEAEQRAEAQIRRPSFRLMSGLEKTRMDSRLPENSETYKRQAQSPAVDSCGQDFPLTAVKEGAVIQPSLSLSPRLVGRREQLIHRHGLDG